MKKQKQKIKYLKNHDKPDISIKKIKINQQRNLLKKKQCKINIYRNKKEIQQNKQKQKPTIIKQRNKT